MKLFAIAVLVMLAAGCWGQTNALFISDLQMTNALCCPAIQDAKNLTADEKKQFMESLESSDRSIWGIGTQRHIVQQAQKLDAERGLEKLIKRAEELNDIHIQISGLATQEYAYSIGYMTRMGIVTQVVNDLAASGDICRIFGHCYPEFDKSMFELVANRKTSYRTCKICGKCESKTEGEWK
jgi:hypothetical protein